jgi:cysteinyl-tRNA synthetase
MEWESPWGTGFPGWHIECSAMSMKYLGDQLDIHCGGTDHIDVHHTNEIAQSEAATGKPFFNVWMHGAFLIISGGKKMAKSEGNFLTLENAFIKRNMDPLAYRYATFLTHYRKPMEYSEEAMAAAQNGLQHLRNQVRTLKAQAAVDENTGTISASYRGKFLHEINDDLNMPRAMAVVQELLKSSLGASDKLATLYDFDRVLGFDLDRIDQDDALPDEIRHLAEQRLQARKDKNWARSDELRDAIQDRGYLVQDTPEGTKVFKP